MPLHVEIQAAQGFIGFMACVAVFPIGATLTRPTQQTLIVSLANPIALGTYLGVSSLSLAIGGAIGNIAGGWLFDLSIARHWQSLPWLLFAAVGLSCAFGLWRTSASR